MACTDAPVRVGVVYAKRPFAGPAAVLAYLSRYTHRVAISNSRLLALDERGVSFRWKDYRAKGKTRYKAMTLSPEEFMSRFLLHVLPSGLHRIRHYGLLANGSRKSNLAAARQFLAVTVDVTPATTEQSQPTTSPLRRHRSSCVASAAAPWRSLCCWRPSVRSAHHRERQRDDRTTSPASCVATGSRADARQSTRKSDQRQANGGRLPLHQSRPSASPGIHRTADITRRQTRP